MAIDLTTIVGYTTQLNVLQQQEATATDPTVKAFLNAQIATVTAQLTSEATHQQNQADASSNMLTSLGLFSTLTTAVGSAAPAIIGLFKP
jgi:hypothetical protein